MHMVIEVMCIVDTQDLHINLVKHVTVRRNTKQSIYRTDGVAGEIRDKRQVRVRLRCDPYGHEADSRWPRQGRERERESDVRMEAWFA